MFSTLRGLFGRSVLEDADKLQAEGVVYKIYNAEFKMDVFFPVPQKFFHPIWVDLAETYLKTQVRLAAGYWSRCC